MNQPELERSLRRIRLSGVIENLDRRNREAIAEKLSYIEFLELLVQDEQDRRRDHLIQRRIKQARFPWLKTLDDFDWSFNPKINQKQFRDLATSEFARKGHGVLLIGPPGTGKSTLSIAVGLACAKLGFKVRYASAFDLAEELAEANALAVRKKRLSVFLDVDLLIIDDFGLKKLPPNAGEDFLEVIHKRHETKSTFLTSNRPFEDWGKILHNDNATATAILDRLFHNGHVITFKGCRSYRMRKNLS